MKVIVTAPFSGAPDGAIYPKSFQPGDIVEGDLARVAVKEKWAAENGAGEARTDGLVPIPEEWETFNAAEMLALARGLGADDTVKTKAAVAVFIKVAEVPRRDEAARA